jgi:hypothetical protein
LATVRVFELIVNVAVTFCAAVMVTVHVPTPEHPPPLQPANVEPTDGAALSCTNVPYVYGSVQSAPQETPAGFEVTVPAPVPAFATVSVYETGVQVKSPPIALLQLPFAIRVCTHHETGFPAVIGDQVYVLPVPLIQTSVVLLHTQPGGVWYALK